MLSKKNRRQCCRQWGDRCRVGSIVGDLVGKSVGIAVEGTAVGISVGQRAGAGLGANVRVGVLDGQPLHATPAARPAQCAHHENLNAFEVRTKPSTFVQNNMVLQNGMGASAQMHAAD